MSHFLRPVNPLKTITFNNVFLWFRLCIQVRCLSGFYSRDFCNYTLCNATPRFGSVHMKEHVKPTKGGPKLFHPSTRVAEEHAKLPLRIRDKVKIYLFLLSSLLLLTVAYKCTYHLFLTTAGHTRTWKVVRMTDYFQLLNLH